VKERYLDESYVFSLFCQGLMSGRSLHRTRCSHNNVQNSPCGRLILLKMDVVCSVIVASPRPRSCIRLASSLAPYRDVVAIPAVNHRETPQGPGVAAPTQEGTRVRNLAHSLLVTGSV
jgi:hypothetical protein